MTLDPRDPPSPDDATPSPRSQYAPRFDVPRLVITGSESTGKTSLATELAESLGTLWVPEYARTYAESVDRELTSADVEPIARGQLASEEEAMAEWVARFADAPWPPPLILDTDLLSTTVYAEHYYGACPPWIAEAARERLGDFYLRCAPDLPWEADGVRDLPAGGPQLHAAFAQRLDEYGALVAPVHGSGARRLEMALDAVRQRFPLSA